jgi:hypothetical protein
VAGERVCACAGGGWVSRTVRGDGIAAGVVARASRLARRGLRRRARCRTGAGRWQYTPGAGPAESPRARRALPRIRLAPRSGRTVRFRRGDTFMHQHRRAVPGPWRRTRVATAAALLSLAAAGACGPRQVAVRTGEATAAESTIEFTNNLSQAVNVYVRPNTGAGEIFLRQVAAQPPRRSRCAASRPARPCGSVPRPSAGTPTTSARTSFSGAGSPGPCRERRAVAVAHLPRARAAAARRAHGWRVSPRGASTWRPVRTRARSRPAGCSPPDRRIAFPSRSVVAPVPLFSSLARDPWFRPHAGGAGRSRLPPLLGHVASVASDSTRLPPDH